MIPTIRPRRRARRLRPRTAVRLGLLASVLAAAVPAAPALADGTLPTAPPPLTLLQSSALTSRGYTFIAPKIDATGITGPQGPEIVDSQGRPVWFQPLASADVQATDFRVQRYHGRRVLTWWQGTSHEGPGHGQGVDYIADSSYHVIATVAAGDGLAADSHEFRLTDRGTALITSYHAVPRDLSSLGGPSGGRVYDGVVQEIDVATGRVLFEWHSLDHVPLSDSYQPVPTSAATPYDYFHVNAVNPDGHGGLLISARHTWTVYDVDARTGAVRWRLGGKHSDFALGAGVAFAWQHNPLPAGPDTIRIFDNASNGTPPQHTSRVIWVRLDQRRRTATLVRALVHPDALSAPSQGNAQDLGDGRTFVGWGQLGRVSELDDAGHLLFDAQLPTGYDTYRAYRFEWTGTPGTPPKAVVDGGVVHAVWNGATQVRRWLVLGDRAGRRHGRGAGAQRLHPIAGAAWNGLDTPIAIPAGTQRVEVLALDGDGRVLGRSAVTPTS